MVAEDGFEEHLEKAAKARVDLGKELEKLPKNHPVVMIMKRAYRRFDCLFKSMCAITNLCQDMLYDVHEHNNRVAARLKDIYHEYNWEAYGYKWDDNLEPIENVVLFYKSVFGTMRYGRIGWIRLKRAVESGNEELILRVAREIVDFPEVSIKVPDEDRREAEEPIRPYL